MRTLNHPHELGGYAVEGRVVDTDHVQKGSLDTVSTYACAMRCLVLSCLGDRPKPAVCDARYSHIAYGATRTCRSKRRRQGYALRYLPMHSLRNARY